jgi:hypothetical protein
VATSQRPAFGQALPLLATLLVLLAGCGGSSTGPLAVASPTATSAGSVCASYAKPSTATPPAGAPASDDLTALGDEFSEAATMANWRDLDTIEGWANRTERADINQTAQGALYLLPYSSVWYNDLSGIFLYKPVSGDFMVTARLRVSGRQTDTPTSVDSLAGLMARAPDSGPWQSGHENWVLVDSGHGSSASPLPQIETKTTVDSDSELQLQPSVADWVYLRLVRVGPVMALLSHAEAMPWQLNACYVRPDLPAELQVGVNAFTDWSSIPQALVSNTFAYHQTQLHGPDYHPDLIARVDYVRFQRPRVPAALTNAIAANRIGLGAWLAYVMRP